MAEALVIPMKSDPDVINLLKMFEENGYQAQRQEYISMLDHFDRLTNQYNTIMDELAAMKERLNGMGDNKGLLAVMVESIGNVLSGIGAKLAALKDSIVEFTQNALNAIRDKGISALGAVSGALHISEGLEAISGTLEKAAAKVENVEQFHLDRVEDSLLKEFDIEIPSDLESLSQDELKALHTKLIDLGMSGDLSSTENKIVQDLMEEIEGKLPEQTEPVTAPEQEAEAEQVEEM